MRGRYGNQVHLRDRLRVRLERELKFSESMEVDRKTSFIDFCKYLGLDAETTSWDMIREMLGEKFIGRVRGGGPPIGCYLVDSVSGWVESFTSINSLVSHLSCYLENKEGSPCASSIVSSTREGCIVTYRGRDNYLVSSLDVDFTTLEHCKNNCLNIRLASQNIGLTVHNFSSVEDITSQLPIVESEDICTREMLCKYFGLEYYNNTHRGFDTSPRRTALLSHNTTRTFDSILDASRYLKVSAKTLRSLHDEGLPCPYRGVDYWIEISDRNV